MLCFDAGCVVPELLDGTNHIPWFKAGELIFEKRGIQYLGINGFINAHSIIATLIVQVPITRVSLTGQFWQYVDLNGNWRNCPKVVQ
jgi:hypothetical protein